VWKKLNSSLQGLRSGPYAILATILGRHRNSAITFGLGLHHQSDVQIKGLKSYSNEAIRKRWSANHKVKNWVLILPHLKYGCWGGWWVVSLGDGFGVVHQNSRDRSEFNNSHIFITFCFHFMFDPFLFVPFPRWTVKIRDYPKLFLSCPLSLMLWVIEQSPRRYASWKERNWFAPRGKSFVCPPQGRKFIDFWGGCPPQGCEFQGRPPPMRSPAGEGRYDDLVRTIWLHRFGPKLCRGITFFYSAAFQCGVIPGFTTINCFWTNGEITQLI